MSEQMAVLTVRREGREQGSFCTGGGAGERHGEERHGSASGGGSSSGAQVPQGAADERVHRADRATGKKRAAEAPPDPQPQPRAPFPARRSGKRKAAAASSPSRRVLPAQAEIEQAVDEAVAQTVLEVVKKGDENQIEELVENGGVNPIFLEAFRHRPSISKQNKKSDKEREVGPRGTPCPECPAECPADWGAARG